MLLDITLLMKHCFDVKEIFFYIFTMLIGDAMDRFVQLRGEEALARLMQRSKRLKVSGIKRTIGIPDNRKEIKRLRSWTILRRSRKSLQIAYSARAT